METQGGGDCFNRSAATGRLDCLLVKVRVEHDCFTSFFYWAMCHIFISSSDVTILIGQHFTFSKSAFYASINSNFIAPEF